MSRVYGPAMVGNDVILGRPSFRKKQYLDSTAFTRKEEKVEPKTEPKNRLPYLFKYMLEATPATGSSQLLEQASYKEEAVKRHFPLRSLLVPAIILIVVAALTAAGLAYKKQIVSTVDNLKTDLSSRSVPKPVPTQILIDNSDYDNALTALITQQVNINAGGKVTTVSPNTIISWLSIRKTDKYTYISVKTNHVAEYINQLAGTDSGIQKEQITSATNQLSDHLLSAKGLTVNL